MARSLTVRFASLHQSLRVSEMGHQLPRRPTAQQVSYRPVAEVISFIVGLGDFRPVSFNRNG